VMLRLSCLLFVSAALAMPLDQPRHDYNVSAGNPHLFDDPSAVAPANGAPMYKQCDSSWGSQRLGTCGLTICQAGCAMSSVTMMLDAHGLSYNPSSLNSWLDGHGGYVSGCDIVWSAVDKLGRTSFQGIETASEAAICSGLSAGHGIIANVNGGKHWVLLTGCRGGGVFDVHDPGFNRATYSHSEILREAVYH